jgi:predicted nucleotidyltransferase component of viral defense system
MLTRPQVQRFASQSGLRDLAIAETEIVLTYLLELLGERSFLDKLAFKGGTCLRKLFIGQGRFSTDLDFTALHEHDPEAMTIEMMEAFDMEFHGITFGLDDGAYYETQDGLSWGANPTYRHEWNQSGQSEIRLQISRRETPTLETQVHTQCQQSYFAQLPFAPRAIRALALEEIIAEKIRACYQRNKARDIYDLRMFATRPLNQNLVRRLVVLKLWQARDTFDPAKLMAKFEDGKDFDWDDLGQLVRRTEKIAPSEITATCVANFRFVANLSEDEAKLATDPYGREHALWDRLRTELPS